MNKNKLRDEFEGNNKGQICYTPHIEKRMV